MNLVYDACQYIQGKLINQAKQDGTFDMKHDYWDDAQNKINEMRNLELLNLLSAILADKDW